jgi:hypothetical protein
LISGERVAVVAQRITLGLRASNPIPLFRVDRRIFDSRPIESTSPQWK